MVKMAKKILYSIAKTSTGQLIKAADAEKGKNYTCPFCNQSFILRKGKKKRPHFAHKSLTPNCTPETALHYTFKTLLHDKIQCHINSKRPLEIKWKCSNCWGWHTGNLLKKAVRVETEYNLGVCRPDVALLDQHGLAIAVIEVIVTHPPEPKVLDYYKRNRIAVVSYLLQSDEDIDRLNSSVLEPNTIDLCTNPKCSKCGNRMAKKRLVIINANCWKCSASMEVAALYDAWGYSISDFSRFDIELAAQKGCFLKSQYSSTVGRWYVASTCKCGAFIGNHYLFTDYIADDRYSREEFDADFYCHRCLFNY